MYLHGEEYVYLSNYINPFRRKLGIPSLTTSQLASLLKRYDKFRVLKHTVYQRIQNFIELARNARGGYDTVYHKNTLNRLLNTDELGLEMSKYADFSDLKSIQTIRNNDELRRNSNHGIAQYREDDIPLPEPSIEYANPASDPNRISDLMTDYENMKESKSIYITESQLDTLKEAWFVESEKVRVVKEYLDKNFMKGSHPIMGEDGEPMVIGIVALIIPGGEPKPMTDKQLFYYLQNHFKNLYSDKKQRDALLKLIIKQWYYDEISPENLLKKNKYSE